jgi:hypothetical protein
MERLAIFDVTLLEANQVKATFRFKFAVIIFARDATRERF